MRKNILFVIVLITLILSIQSCNQINANLYEFKLYNETDSMVAIRIASPIGYSSICIEESNRRRLKEIIRAKEFTFNDTVLFLSCGETLIFDVFPNDNGSGDYEKDGIIPVWSYIKSITVGSKEMLESEYVKDNWEYHCSKDDDLIHHEYHLYIREN